MSSVRLGPAVRTGAIAGAVMALVVTIGFLEATGRREVLTDLLSLSTVFLAMVAIITGYSASGAAASRAEPRPLTILGAGALAGLVGALILAAFTLFATTVDVRDIFANLRPQGLEHVTFGFEPIVAAGVIVASGPVLGAAGAGLRILSPLMRRIVVTTGLTVVVLSVMEAVFRVMLSELGLRSVASFFYRSGALTIPGALVIAVVTIAAVWVGRAEQSPLRQRLAKNAGRERDRRASLILYIVVAIGLLVLPRVIGSFPSDVVSTAGLYILLGLGLNIVVGYAGLLDLGYVAFFAIGAYSVALLTSPESVMNLQWDFWFVLPLVLVIAAVAGIAIGAPVLRLRGDYLAIVTLGFGEIVRLLFLSDWLKPFTGAGQGILDIPPPSIPGLDFPGRDPQEIYYPILFFCVVAAVVAYRLANSRVGRAWNAMREDEQVAEATGINTTNYKLLAFALGATFGCLAGALFAAKIGVIFPHSFEILVSITALAVIILGGMGSIRGVIVGGLVLVGLPELLREFDEYRLLVYGAVLVAMMLVRPEGLVPSAQRRRELHDSDEPEDQYAMEAGVETGRPVVTSG
jgi:branched-chain amino acid transport system permease protein